MSVPAYHDEQEPLAGDSREEPSFGALALAGGILILLYILVFVLLRPA